MEATKNKENTIDKEKTEVQEVFLDKAPSEVTFTRSSSSQIYSSGLLYAILSDDYSACTPFAYCKDFFQDVVQASIEKKNTSIYGFSFTYKKDPNPCLTSARFAVTHDKKVANKLRLRCKRSKSFINLLEKDLGFSSRTNIYDGGKVKIGKVDRSIVVFDGPKEWISHPLLISLYTSLIRFGMSYDRLHRSWKKHFLEGKFERVTDGNRGKQHYALCMVLSEIGPKSIFKSFDPETNFKAIKSAVHELHNCTGVVSFSQYKMNYKHYGTLNLTQELFEKLTKFEEEYTNVRKSLKTGEKK